MTSRCEDIGQKQFHKNNERTVNAEAFEQAKGKRQADCLEFSLRIVLIHGVTITKIRPHGTFCLIILQPESLSKIKC